MSTVPIDGRGSPRGEKCLHWSASRWDTDAHLLLPHPHPGDRSYALRRRFKPEREVRGQRRWAQGEENVSARTHVVSSATPLGDARAPRIRPENRHRVRRNYLCSSDFTLAVRRVCLDGGCRWRVGEHVCGGLAVTQAIGPSLAAVTGFARRRSSVLAPRMFLKVRSVNGTSADATRNGYGPQSAAAADPTTRLPAESVP